MRAMMFISLTGRWQNGHKGYILHEQKRVQLTPPRRTGATLKDWEKISNQSFQAGRARKPEPLL
jgi:hypothetical protein